mmetsp:Transcript_27022/g.23852  ORF Transcript_27022/g.23852 Transcript_27022/m.23852 type:complete len:122 (+) Transcript_27022:546-911(+)
MSTMNKLMMFTNFHKSSLLLNSPGIKFSNMAQPLKKAHNRSEYSKRKSLQYRSTKVSHSRAKSIPESISSIKNTNLVTNTTSISSTKLYFTNYKEPSKVDGKMLFQKMLNNISMGKPSLDL